MFRPVSVFLILIMSFNLFSLTLEEYLNIVMKGNISIKSKTNASEKSEWSRLQSYSGYLPSLDLGGSFYYSRYNEERLDKDPAIPNLENPLYTRKITMSLPVFVGGSRVLGNMIAEKNKEISTVEIENEKLAVEASAVAAYFQTFITQENIKLSQKAVKAATENLRTANLLLESGRTTELAYLNLELVLKKREQELENYKLEMLRNIADMSRIAASDMEFDSLEKSDFSLIEKHFLDKDHFSLFENKKSLLLSSSPLLLKMEKLKKISDYSAIMKMSPFLPVLSFSFVHDFGSAEDHPFKKTYLYDDDVVSLNFSWNLFKGFNDTIEWRKSLKDKVASQLAYLETKNAQMYSLKAVLASILSLLEQKKVAQASVEISAKALEKSRVEFESGKSLYLDLLNSENSYYEALKNLVFIENSIFNSFYQLRILTGGSEE
ncbi:MAG TPA: TolC family protein, partial [bacterium]|nr:TolC family protein [bacterium]